MPRFLETFKVHRMVGSIVCASAWTAGSPLAFPLNGIVVGLTQRRPISRVGQQGERGPDHPSVSDVHHTMSGRTRISFGASNNIAKLYGTQTKFCLHASSQLQSAAAYRASSENAISRRTHGLKRGLKSCR